MFSSRSGVYLYCYLQSCHKAWKSGRSTWDGKTYIRENHSATNWQACIALEDVMWHDDCNFNIQYFGFLSYVCTFSSTSLFNLYNLLENPYSRFFVYMKALNLAVNGKVAEHIIPSLKKIDSFLKEWNVEIKDKRELFLGVANVLKESKRYRITFRNEILLFRSLLT